MAFVSSSLTFEQPYAGQSTRATLKLLTANDLNQGDIITLTLKGLTFPGVQDIYIQGTNPLLDLNPPPPQLLMESLSMREWNWGHNSLTGVFSLQVPQSLSPTALQFDVLVTLPKTGIALTSWNPTGVAVRGGSSNRTSSSTSSSVIGKSSPTFAMTVQRGGKMLAPQPLQYVQPVCFVQKNTLRFIPASRTYHRYNTSAANNRNRTSTLPFTTVENRTWSLQVELFLNSPLNAGDSITLYAPHYQYHNNIRDLPVIAGVSFAPPINTTLARLAPGYNNATNSSITPLVAYTGSTNVVTKTITVVATYPLPNTTVRFTILNHPDLTVPTQKCNGNNCPIAVTIDSLSCPLQGRILPFFTPLFIPLTPPSSPFLTFFPHCSPLTPLPLSSPLTPNSPLPFPPPLVVSTTTIRSHRPRTNHRIVSVRLNPCECNKHYTHDVSHQSTLATTINTTY